MKKLIVTAIALLFVLPAFAADRDYQQSFSVSPTGSVSVELIAGRIEVMGWDQATVEITAVLGEDVEEVDVDADGESVEIEVDLRSGHNLRHGHAELTIRMPVGASLEIEAVSAPVHVENVQGAIELEVVSGDITVSGVSDSVEIEAVSGTIDLTTDGVIRGGSFETVSGSILVDGVLAEGEDFDFETVSGNIELRIPADSNARFDIETFSGEIKNDFGFEPVKESQWVPAQSLSFKLGTGAASVSIEAFSGRVEVKKR